MIFIGEDRISFTRCLAVTFVFFLVLGILSAACVPELPVTQPPESQLPVSRPSESPALPTPHPARWSADGVINAGEYTEVKKLGDYEIHWLSDNEYIYIAMKAETTGWVALGIQPGSMMKDADIILGFVKNGKAEVADHFSTGIYGPHSLDTEFGGTDDIIEFGGQEMGGYTTIEFKRLLNTGDKYDMQLSNGVNKIIWSYGLDDQSTEKHVSRGYAEIDIQSR